MTRLSAASLHRRVPCAALGLALSMLAAGARMAAAAPRDEVDAHFQATYIWQRKPAFGAAYSGPNSLATAAETSYTFSATAFLGLRPAPGLEVFVNPELIQGVPLSNLTGLGSPTNGEIQKVAGPNPKLYLPRLFLRKTWNLDGADEEVESAPNQFAGTRGTNRWVLSAGKLAVVDIFDANAYSHDARTQFLTWASLANGAYDYVADAQGYTWGAAIEYLHGAWALRYGRFAGPKESNGQSLDLRIFTFHGDQLELEHGHEIGGRPGALRLLLWANRLNMGRFGDAIELAQRDGGTPDVARVRRPERKWGWGLHLEQALGANVGGFLRYGWADGRTETYSYEEVERSAQIGAVVKGAAWGRDGDTLGLLVIRNGLSPVHRQYLAFGGLGYFIGDGRLSYRTERVAEAYCNLGLAPGLWLGLDLQHIRNPAYNADRGPVRVYGARLHAAY